MPRVLHKIRDPQTEQINLNNNFDKISQDLADSSGAFSSTDTTGGILMNAGTVLTVEISLIEVRSTHTVGKLPVIPRFDIYVDNDNEGSYLLPLGSSLTSAEKLNIRVGNWQSKSVLNQAADEKATYILAIYNDDASAHTIYVHFDSFYVPAPQEGVAVRTA